MAAGPFRLWEDSLVCGRVLRVDQDAVGADVDRCAGGVVVIRLLVGGDIGAKESGKALAIDLSIAVEAQLPHSVGGKTNLVIFLG